MRGRRAAAWIAAVLALGYVALGLSRITLDVDITRLLPAGMKETAGYRLFLKNFSHAGELMVTLEGSSAEEVEAVAASLPARLGGGQQPLARRVVWRSPIESQSPGMIEFLAWSLLNQPAEKLAALERRLAPEQLVATLEATLEKLATSLDGTDGLLGYDPLGLTTDVLSEAGRSRELTPDFVSRDGTFRVVFVESANALPNYDAMTGWLREVRASIEEEASPRGVTVQFTGEPAFVSEISNSMEHDMKLSGGVALALVCLIVWIGYRRLRLLPVLVAMLGLIFVLTLSTCGLALGSLTVLTVGFGSILIGLAVDFGVLIFAAERTAESERADARRRTRRGIFWAALTTSASFAALVPCGMPGLAELGLLVAVGVVLGALVFVFVFPRLLAALRIADAPIPSPEPVSRRPPPGWVVWAVGLLVLAAWSGLALKGLPKVAANSGSLRPRVSEAYAAFDRLQARLGGGAQALSVLVAGRDENEVAARLEGLEKTLAAAKSVGSVSAYALPRALWPVPAIQRENLTGPATRLAADRARLKAGVIAAGFTEEAFGLAEGVFKQWEKSAARESRTALWPADDGARWLLRRFALAPGEVATDDPAQQCLCLGMLRLRDEAALSAIESLQTEGIYLAGPSLLDRVMDRFLRQGFIWLAVTFGAVTFGLLALALKRWQPFLLTLISLTLGFGALIGAMSWLGLPWNAFTLPALLLSLGTGSDYFIYVIFELEEHGSPRRMHSRLLRPLLVCVGNSVCGFGSLAWANNLGLSSLGRVCALALAFNVLVALFVLPVLWTRWRRRA